MPTMDMLELSLKGQPLTAMITMPTLNKLHKITLDDKILVGPQFETIRRRIYREMNIDITDMPDGNVWETKRGLWPKRFKSWTYKVFGIKDVDPKLLSDIGGVMGKMTVKQSFYVDFVNEAKWTAGSFGEKCSSCWWSTSYGRARLGLFEKGGIAMRFFSSPRQRSINKGQKGIGRAWLFPTGDDLFLFNSYGFEMQISARVLAAILGQGWRYDTVPFYISDAYINSDHAVRFSQSGFDPREHISLPSITSRYVGYCYHCGEKVKANDYKDYMDRNESVRIYHPDCAEHDLCRCSYCSEYALAEEMTHLAHYNKRVCQSCISNYYTKCGDCGRHMERRNINDVKWTNHREIAVCDDCLPKHPRCECGNYFKNRTTMRKHQDNCRTYRRNHRPAITERITMDELRRAWEDSRVSGPEYQEMIDRYAEQEGTTRSDVHDHVLAYRPNPTPSISVADLHRALVDDRVSHADYHRLLNQYAEQERITYLEAHNRANCYEPQLQVQDPPEISSRPEPTIQTWGDVLDSMAQQDAESQSTEAQGVSPEAELVGQAGIDILAPAILDGSQPVESPSQGQGWEFIGRSPMDRLRGEIQRNYSSTYWHAYYDWQQQPERTTEPLAGINRGLSEQEVQRLREAIYTVENTSLRGTWAALYNATRDLHISGVPGNDNEQDTTTETE